MSDETVLVELNWTFGVNTPTGLQYFGPGRVLVPAAVAQAQGWKPVETETAIDDETAVSETVQEKVATLLINFVTDHAGFPHLTEPLTEAGFTTGSAIIQASTADLTAVPGIGKATAAKLKTAAEELLNGD